MRQKPISIHVAHKADLASILIRENANFESSFRIEAGMVFELMGQIDGHKRSCTARAVTKANRMVLKNFPITVLLHRQLNREYWATTGNNGVVMLISCHSKAPSFPVQMAMLKNEADIKRQISAVHEIWDKREIGLNDGD